MICVRWQPGRNGRHLEQKCEVILLGLSEAVATDHGALDTLQEPVVH